MHGDGLLDKLVFCAWWVMINIESRLVTETVLNQLLDVESIGLCNSKSMLSGRLWLVKDHRLCSLYPRPLSF